MGEIMKLERWHNGCGVTLRFQSEYGGSLKIVSLHQGETRRLMDMLDDYMDHPSPYCLSLRCPSHRHDNDACRQAEENFPAEFDPTCPNHPDGTLNCPCRCHQASRHELGLPEPAATGDAALPQTAPS